MSHQAMYTWGWSISCMFGLHWLCAGEWRVLGGRQTCSCDKGDHRSSGRRRHRRVHTNTFSDKTGTRVPKRDDT